MSDRYFLIYNLLKKEYFPKAPLFSGSEGYTTLYKICIKQMLDI